MGTVCKVATRTAVIGAVGAVAFVAIAGKAKTHAILNQAKHNLSSAVDHFVGDPVALREQLRSLEAEYPKRIAAVRSDLTELNTQKDDLTRELQISQRVVSLAEQDLSGMSELITRAEDTISKQSGYTMVKIVHGGDRMDMDQAIMKATHIRQTRDAYAIRAVELDRDLGFLAEQESRLTDLLSKLETERSDFQTQLWQLDSQIDAIARNERLIDMMEAREKTIDEQSRYKVASIDQLHAKMADIRAKQEASLESLSNRRERLGYEDRAKLDLGSPNSIKSGSFLGTTTIEIQPKVVDICPDDDTDREDDFVPLARRGH